MMKGKRTLLLLLVLAMLWCSGCAASMTGTTPTDGTTAPAAQPDTAEPGETEPDATEPETAQPAEPTVTEPEMYPEGKIDISVTYLPETVENPDNLPVLKWVCLLLNRKYIEIQWTQDPAVRLNRMLADSGASFRVQFVVVTQADSSEYIGNGYYEWMYHPEIVEIASQADLLFAFLNEADIPRYLHPVTEFVEGEGENPLACAVPHEVYWRNGTVGGEIYGMYSNAIPPYAEAWEVDGEVFAEYGLTQEDFQHQYWEMDEVFADIYAKNGGKPFLYGDLQDGYTYNLARLSYEPGIFAWQLERYQNATACYAIDYTGGTPEVVNFLDTDYLRNMLAAYQRYKKAGYFTDIQEKSAVAFTCARADFVYSYADSRYIPVGTLQRMGTEVGGFMIGVGADTAYLEEAVQLLSRVGSDETFRELLLYGVEGQDYEIRDGLRVLMPRADGTEYSMAVLSPLADFTGELLESSADNIQKEEGRTRLQTHQDMVDRSAIWYGFFFDYGPVEDEVKAVNEILMGYYEEFSELTPQAYEQMLLEIEEAGGDEIMLEIRRQLDQYLADFYA